MCDRASTDSFYQNMENDKIRFWPVWSYIWLGGLLQWRLCWYFCTSTFVSAAPIHNKVYDKVHDVPDLYTAKLYNSSQQNQTSGVWLLSHYALSLLVGWLSGRTLVSDRRTFTGLHRTCSWWVTIYMGKPSAVGQPTRPTQPFILTGSINE